MEEPQLSKSTSTSDTHTTTHNDGGNAAATTLSSGWAAYAATSAKSQCSRMSLENGPRNILPPNSPHTTCQSWGRGQLGVYTVLSRTQRDENRGRHAVASLDLARAKTPERSDDRADMLQPDRAAARPERDALCAPAGATAIRPQARRPHDTHRTALLAFVCT